MFFAIFYFCCDFVFIIVNADVTFFLFLSKGFFKRFFLSQTLVFLLCLSKCFFCNFYTCCNFIFYSCTICVTFPLCYRKIFGWFFNRIFTEICLLLPFCGISLAVHVIARKFLLSFFSLLFYFTTVISFLYDSYFLFYNLLSKIKNFRIKNAVTTVFFHGHHGNFISFYVFLYTICFTGRMKYNTSSLLFIVITQLLCWANCIFMASAFITLRQSLRYFAL